MSKSKVIPNPPLLDLLWLSALALVFISIFAFIINGQKNITVAKVEVEPISKVFTDVPVLSSESNLPILSAQAALAIDLDSGVSLYEKNPDEGFLPASTTKIVTALVAMDYYETNDILKVIDPSVEGRKMGLVVGEELTVSDLLQGLLIYSANDAAEVLAQNYPGGRENFITAMNLKADQLGLRNTQFTNPSGLDGGRHLTTARDLHFVANIAMKEAFFREIVSTKEAVAESVNGNIKHRLVNTNELLGSVEGVMGVKTGWTENARENLVTYITRNDKEVIIVLLASQDRFGETQELIEWIFDNYEWQEVKYESEPTR